jgi:hypothetical protein
MWWCTVRDGIVVNPDEAVRERGHIWLTCSQPWSNQSVGGRPLVRANLPGTVTTVASFKGTICEPASWEHILRVIRDEENPDAAAARAALENYRAAVAKLVAHLHERDFELLIDLILSRTGWVRLAKLGGVIEGIDIEAENVAANEIAFVQVKSQAGQSVLDDYVERFNNRRDRYDRMIFAVHSPVGALIAPKGEPVQVWTGNHIARLVVQLGLGEWVAQRL